RNVTGVQTCALPIYSSVESTVALGSTAEADSNREGGFELLAESGGAGGDTGSAASAGAVRRGRGQARVARARSAAVKREPPSPHRPHHTGGCRCAHGMASSRAAERES